jgi:hypothetical protein
MRSLLYMALLAGCAPPDSGVLDDNPTATEVSDEKSDLFSRLWIGSFSDSVGAQPQGGHVFTSAAAYQAFFHHAPPSSVSLGAEWVVFYSAGPLPKGSSVSIDGLAISSGGATLLVTPTVLSKSGNACPQAPLRNLYLLGRIRNPGAAVRYSHFYPHLRVRSCPAPRAQVPNQGGPVLAHPEIVTVAWADDPLLPSLQAFDGWLSASSYFAALSEYGIGAGSHLAPAPFTVDLTGKLADGDVRTLLSSAIQGGVLPPPNADRVYVLYFTAGVSVEELPGYASCSAFDGYHQSFLLGGERVIYAVIPRCPPEGSWSQLDQVTVTASHEIVEAITDPRSDARAWLADPSQPWASGGAELADLCEATPQTVDGHFVTGIYSNRAAAAGARACAPSPPGPDFGTESIAVTIGAGKTATANLHVFATAPLAAPLALSAYPATTGLTVTPQTGGFTVGDTIPLQISVSSGVTSGSQLRADVALIASDYLTLSHVVVNVP